MRFLEACRSLSRWGCLMLLVSAALAWATPERLRPSVVAGQLGPTVTLVALLAVIGYGSEALRRLGPVLPFLLAVAIFLLLAWGVGGLSALALGTVVALSDPAGVGQGLRANGAWAAAFGCGALYSLLALRVWLRSLRQSPASPGAGEGTREVKSRPQ
jgi:hypothetical protein